jgi:hypothetical protein
MGFPFSEMLLREKRNYFADHPHQYGLGYVPIVDESLIEQFTNYGFLHEEDAKMLAEFFAWRDGKVVHYSSIVDSQSSSEDITTKEENKLPTERNPKKKGAMTDEDCKTLF